MPWQGKRPIYAREGVGYPRAVTGDAAQTFEVRVTAPFTDVPLRPGATPVRV